MHSSVKYLFIVFVILFLQHCSSDNNLTVSADQITFKNDIVFLIDSDKPFSGVVISYHEDGELDYRYEFLDGEMHGMQKASYDQINIRKYSVTCYQNNKKADLVACN
jgi:antitoxin component YwqK of YwqJK toxin-antitoxin module